MAWPQGWDSLLEWLIVALFLVQASVLAGLFAKRVFDPRFETYQNYLFLTVALGILVRLHRKSIGRRLFFLFLAPLLWGNTFFIAVAITVIVNFNDEVYLKTTFFNGGVNSVAIVHSFDWILHQVPFYIMLVVVLASFTHYRHYFREFWLALDTPARVIYSLYVILCSAAWQLLYMASFPFGTNYPVPIPTWGVLLSVLGTCILINSLLYIALAHKNISVTKPHTKTT